MKKSISNTSVTKWCPSNEMRCNLATSNNECVRKELVCDGYCNCPSGEDETNCGEPTQNATTTTITALPKTTTTPKTITSTMTTITSSPKTTTMTPRPTPTPTPGPKHNCLGTGLIALIVIAIIVTVVVVIGGITFVFKKRRNNIAYKALN